MDQEKSETPSGYAANEAAQQAIVDHYRRILLDLATCNPDPRTLSGEYAEVHALFGERGNPERWRYAADRIRVQRGLREKFHRGLIHAGQYREHILEIFREEGVPEEIAWLPMVESMFNVEARSKVGAAGVWQFMPGTGRLYMRVDGTVDQRLDPIVAARGAARLLRNNYRGLGSWPLALTAYNHGYYGMRRAVAQVGTNDYMTIRRLYDGRRSASRARTSSPSSWQRCTWPSTPSSTSACTSLSARSSSMSSRCRWRCLCETSRARCRWMRTASGRLEPSLTDDVWAGRRPVPAGFSLRVRRIRPRSPPPAEGFCANRALNGPHSARNRRAPAVHTVQRGGTLVDRNALRDLGGGADRAQRPRRSRRDPRRTEAGASN